MIERYGLPNNTSKDVKVVAKNMVAEQFVEMTAKRMPIFEMDNKMCCRCSTTKKLTTSMSVQSPMPASL